VSTGEVTSLLAAWRAGDDSAFDRLLPLVYEELRGRAHRQLGGGAGQTLSTTALVHECYLKLVDSGSRGYADRAHFLAVATRAMRQILVDHARRARAAKRGGGGEGISVEVDALPAPVREEELLALDAALEELVGLEPQLARLVELRFFGGLSVDEVATLLERSPRTVKRDWRRARAFLVRAMSEDGVRAEGPRGGA